MCTLTVFVLLDSWVLHHPLYTHLRALCPVNTFVHSNGLLHGNNKSNNV